MERFRISERRQRHALIAIIVLGLLLRLATLLSFGNSVTSLPGIDDQVSYHALALRVLNGYGFTFGENWWPATAAGAPTAHWSYLYTFFLAGVYRLFGVQPLIARLIQILIVAILQPYFTWRIGRTVFGPVAGLLAAAISAIYIYFIYYSAALMTESFYIVAVLAVLWLLLRLVQVQPEELRGVAVLLGLAIGVAVLLRQLFLLLVPVLLLWAIWARYRRHRQLSWRPLVATCLIIGALVLPFTAYNYARFERFVLLNTNAGYVLFWANHPIHGTQFKPILPAETSSYQDLIPAELRSLDEAALEAALLQRGIAFVVEEPGRYLLLSLSRIPAYFIFWPSSASGLLSNVSRVLSFGLFLPFMLVGLWLGVCRSGLDAQRYGRLASLDVVLYLFVLLYTTIHVLTWTLVRYRLPVDSVLVVFAGVALTALARRFFTVEGAARERSPDKVGLDGGGVRRRWRISPTARTGSSDHP